MMRMSWLMLFTGFIILRGAGAEMPRVSYDGISSSAFMNQWLICGPFPATAAAILPPTESLANTVQHRRIGPLELVRQFDFDYLRDQGGEERIQPAGGLVHSFIGRTYEWRRFEQEGPVLDLEQHFGPMNYVVVYLYAEVVLPAAQECRLALGSDDSVKIWLNGTLIHERWGGRQARIDQDVISIKLNEGVNRLLCKVQNETFDWQFVCRLLNEEDYRQLQAEAEESSVRPEGAEFSEEEFRYISLSAQFLIVVLVIVIVAVSGFRSKT